MIFDMSSTIALMLSDSTRSTWRLLNARSCRVSEAARSVALRISAMSLRRASLGSRLRASRSVKPRIAVSRLLKSCATPPASWPTASIFCAWRNVLLEAAALGDVARYGQHFADEPGHGIAHGLAGGLEPDVLAVAPPRAEGHRLRALVAGKPRRRRAHRLEIVGMTELEYRHADEIGAARIRASATLTCDA